MGIKIKNWFLKFQLKKLHLLFKHCSFSFRKAFSSFWAENKISCILRHFGLVKWGPFGWKLPDLGHFSKILTHENEGKPSKWPKSGSFQPKRPPLSDSECRRMHEIVFSAQNQTIAFQNEKESVWIANARFSVGISKINFLILMPILAFYKIA